MFADFKKKTAAAAAKKLEMKKREERLVDEVTEKLLKTSSEKARAEGVVHLDAQSLKDFFSPLGRRDEYVSSTYRLTVENLNSVLRKVTISVVGKSE